MAHVVFTLSVRFGGHWIGYVTSGRDSELFPATSQAALVRPLLLWFSLYPFFVLVPRVCGWGDFYRKRGYGWIQLKGFIGHEVLTAAAWKACALAHWCTVVTTTTAPTIIYVSPISTTFGGPKINIRPSKLLLCSITNETPAVRAGWCNQLKHGDLATKPG